MSLSESATPAVVSGRMKLSQVTLYARITDAQGHRHYERINRRNPQLGPGIVYCLRYEVEGKRRWETVGTDLTAANQARMNKEQELLSGARAVDEAKPSPAQPDSLEQLREAFLSDKRTSRKKNGELRDEETIRAYEQLTTDFINFVNVKTPAQITAKILKAWITSLYERRRHGGDQPVSHRTVCNLYINTVCFLHFLGIDHKRLVPEAERPSAIEEEPEAYTDTELTRFFNVIVEERDRLFFKFLRHTGAREREATHLEWSNLNLGATPTVTFRNQGGFKTKTRKFRTVPLIPSLAQELRVVWRLTHGNDKYVFGRADGEVEGHYLRLCKAYAKTAGLNEDDFWLHKFRDTACTNWLLRGVPLRTCQKWMGHSSITMTERYLAPAEDDVQQSLMAKCDDQTLAVPATA